MVAVDRHPMTSSALHPVLPATPAARNPALPRLTVKAKLVTGNRPKAAERTLRDPDQVDADRQLETEDQQTRLSAGAMIGLPSGAISP